MKYKLEKVNCNICGSNEYAVYIKDAEELYNGLDGTFDVVQCVKCGFKFTNPRPTPDTIGYFYPVTAGYYKPEHPKRVAGLKKRLVNSILTNYYGYHLGGIPKILDFSMYLFYRVKRKFDLAHIPRYVEHGKLLDVGCSWGKYLCSMKNLGWEVYGIEMHEQAVKYAAEELGLKVRQGTIDNMDFGDAFFDVINMSMVLEHLHDPSGILIEAYRLLKANGRLILSIPDISGFEAWIFRGKAYCLHVPQHLNHFTPETVGLLLEKTGFRVEKLLHHNSVTDMIKSASYLDNKLLFRILSSKLVAKLFVRPVVKVLSLVGKTSRMTVYAIKSAGAE
jgi:2-polyprenyl-3-methyl-5-hydroxy-6-metoxy-1,4-benzoquinol methylase